MSKGKFVTVLIILVIVAVAIYKFKKVKSSEGYTPGHSLTWKKERVFANSEQGVAKGDFYSVPGQYQPALNPRFSNLNYGANIRYKMPSHKNLAVPYDPLTFGDMVHENFGNVETPRKVENFSDENFEYPEATDMVPVGDMNTVNSLGETVQPIVYDRFIYANRNSRLRALGDPIRGDLPIVPCSGNWFRPSVHPNIDLQEGAMNVMGGVNNDTTQALAELINSTSGDSTIAGVNMAAMKDVYTGQAMSTVDIVGFP
jgi:Family of unknown function (DUF5850)